MLKQPIHIGSIIRNAAAFNPNNLIMNTDELIVSVQRLFKLLKERKIEYVLVGGIAVRHYVDSRNTDDVDIIIATDSLKLLPEILITGKEKFFARGKFQNVQVDLLLTSHPLFKKIQLEYSQLQEFIEQEIKCATVEGLLLMKLYALPALYKDGNFTRVSLYENDLAMLMNEYQPNMSELLNKLSPYLDHTEMESVREIANEIEEKIKRFRDRR